MNIVTHRGRRKTEFSMRASEGLLREVVAAQCKNFKKKEKISNVYKMSWCLRECPSCSADAIKKYVTVFLECEVT